MVAEVRASAAARVASMPTKARHCPAVQAHAAKGMQPVGASAPQLSSMDREDAGRRASFSRSEGMAAASMALVALNNMSAGAHAKEHQGQWMKARNKLLVASLLQQAPCSAP